MIITNIGLKKLKIKDFFFFNFQMQNSNIKQKNNVWFPSLIKIIKKFF